MTQNNDINSGFRSIKKTNIKRTTLSHVIGQNSYNNEILSNDDIYKTSSQLLTQTWQDNHNSHYLSNLSNPKLLNNKNVMLVNNDQLNNFGNINTTFAPKIIQNVPVFDVQYKDNHCYLSNQNVQFIQQFIENVLKNMLDNNELKIDYQKGSTNNYEFQGRIYTSDCADFLISIYKLKKTDINGNISMVEVRKTFGESFGYFTFEEMFLKKLEDKKIIKKEEKFKVNHSFGMLSPLGELSLTLDDEDEINVNITSDSDDDNNTFSINTNDEEFDFNLCETLLETLYDKKSYREEYIHDSYQFSQYLKSDDKQSKNMINYILKNEKDQLIEKIMEPIIENKLYCTFIIVNILESIEHLLSIKEIKSQLVIPDEFKYTLFDLMKTWSNENGVKNTIGPINVSYCRSQQIERRCESILKLL